MCGRFTDLYTWAEIHAYYSLIGETPTNWGPNYNVCPTQPVGAIVLRDGKRRYERMRWGLVPSWWSKPLKELRLATFNARAERAAAIGAVVVEKPLLDETLFQEIRSALRV